MAALYEPRSTGELYLARGPEVNARRPIYTGDVFRDIDLPGVDEADDMRLAIVMAHPCSMREGVELRDRVLMARVLPAGDIPLTAWKLHISKCPLPELFGSEAAEPTGGIYAVFLDLVGRVPATELHLSRRVACLDALGVAILMQRKIMRDTRLEVEVEALIESCEPVWQETELAEEWCDAMIPHVEGEGAEDISSRLSDEMTTFDAVLSAEREVGSGKKARKHTLREDLSAKAHRTGAARVVRRQMREEIARRVEQSEDTGE